MLVATSSENPRRSNGLSSDAWIRSARCVAWSTEAFGSRIAELVAAEPRGSLVLAQRLQAQSELLEEQVAGAVPEGVVDLLEAVDVEEHHDGSVSRWRRRADRLHDPAP